MSYPQCPISPAIAAPPCEALTENTYGLEGSLTYRVTMPTVTVYTDATGTHTMVFDHWTDDPSNKNPVRNVLLNMDTILNAAYIEQIIVTVGGQVSDAAGPIQGASVNLTLGNVVYDTVTNPLGLFSLDVPIASGYTMTVSHLGHQTYNSPPFDITGPTSTLNVTLTSAPPTPQPHTRIWVFAHSLPRISASWPFLLIEIYDGRMRTLVGTKTLLNVPVPKTMQEGAME